MWEGGAFRVGTQRPAFRVQPLRKQTRGRSSNVQPEKSRQGAESLDLSGLHRSRIGPENSACF